MYLTGSRPSGAGPFFVVGIDGGGSKTEAVLLDESGEVAAVGHGGSVNTIFVEPKVAQQSIKEAIVSLVPVLHGRSIARAGACLLGGRKETEEMLQEIGLHGPLFWFSEMEVAFRRAGLKTCVGVAVIAGTGSSFQACNGQKRENLGGWGMGVGDEGSGFDIALKAIRAAGRSLDGRGPKTLLLDLLLDKSGTTSFYDLLNAYCRPVLRQRDIAAFASVVTCAARQGDRVATDILTAAGESLGEDAAFLAHRLFRPDDEFDVVLSGGVFNAEGLVVGPLERRVQAEFPKARISVQKMSAGEAVARLTLERVSE